MDEKEYELFKNNILDNNESKKGPLEVESLKFEEMSEAQLKEQQEVYKALEDTYCVCNHSKKHHSDNNCCQFRASRFNNGRIQEFKCECPHFVSKKERRLQEEQWQKEK